MLSSWTALSFSNVMSVIGIMDSDNLSELGPSNYKGAEDSLLLLLARA